MVDSMCHGGSKVGNSYWHYFFNVLFRFCGQWFVLTSFFGKVGGMLGCKGQNCSQTNLHFCWILLDLGNPPDLGVLPQLLVLAAVASRLFVDAISGSRELFVFSYAFCPELVVVVARLPLLSCDSVTCCCRSFGPVASNLHSLQSNLKSLYMCTDSMCVHNAPSVSSSLGQKAHLQKYLGLSNRPSELWLSTIPSIAPVWLSFCAKVVSLLYTSLKLPSMQLWQLWICWPLVASGLTDCLLWFVLSVLTSLPLRPGRHSENRLF